MDALSLLRPPHFSILAGEEESPLLLALVLVSNPLPNGSGGLWPAGESVGVRERDGDPFPPPFVGLVSGVRPLPLFPPLLWGDGGVMGRPVGQRH